MFDLVPCLDSQRIPSYRVCREAADKTLMHRVVECLAPGTAPGYTTRYSEAVPPDLNEDELPLIVEALRHLAAYRRAVDRDPRPYELLAEKLEAPNRKPAAKEALSAKRAAKNKR